MTRAIPADLTAEPTEVVAQDEAGDGEGRVSASQVLVAMALDHYALGVSDTEEPFAVRQDAPHLALLLRGGRTGLRAELASRYFDSEGRAAPAQALADALLVLEGLSMREAARPLHLRVGESDGVVYVDCGDTGNRAVKISGGSWSIVDQTPILFRRTKLTLPLAEPVRGHGVDELWRFAAIQPEDRPLVLAWLVSTLIQPNTPHPILQLKGEQGTAKSSSSRTLIDLVDPSAVPLRNAPRNEDDFVTMASASWAFAVDNLSAFSAWLSDALCRASTGAGSVKRALYTDHEVAAISFLRCMIINGITLGGLRGDLAERVVAVELQTIDPAERKAEADLQAEWVDAKPRILGGLLDLAAKVHAKLPTIRLQESPRMADFAKVLAAVDELTGLDGMGRYATGFSGLANEVIAEEPFTAAILEHGYCCDGVPAKQILAELKQRLTVQGEKFRAPEGWPKSVRAASDLLVRSAPAFRKIGWTVFHDGGKNITNAKLWTFRQPERVGKSDSSNSSSSYEQVNGLNLDELGKMPDSFDELENSLTSYAPEPNSSKNSALSREYESDESYESEMHYLSGRSDPCAVIESPDPATTPLMSWEELADLPF